MLITKVGFESVQQYLSSVIRDVLDAKVEAADNFCRNTGA